jgi:hypothetical protein
MRLSAHVAEMLRTSNLKGVWGEHLVWRIDGYSREIEELRNAILQEALSRTSGFVNYDDDPDDGLGVHPIRIRVDDSKKPRWLPARMWNPYRIVAWEIPRATPVDALRGWLYTGNWQFYVADHYHAWFPDLCRGSYEFVAGFTEAANIELVIDSFHDDIEWTIGLAPYDA